jgi:hypothetical protein
MTLTNVDIDPSGFDRRFLVELFIVHPTIAPSEITNALGVEAHFAHMVGEARRTPKGNTLPGRYPDTRWRHSIQYITADQWFVGEVEALVNGLEPHKAFLHHLLDTGGKATLIIQFLGDGYFGDSLPSPLLAKIVELRLRLGLEVFTVPQS